MIYWIVRKECNEDIMYRIDEKYLCQLSERDLMLRIFEKLNNINSKVTKS